MEQSKAHYLSGVVLSAGANLAGMAASLATIMVAARLLSKDELGAFFLVMVVVQFVALFSDLGLKNTAIRALSSLPPQSAEFIQTARYLLTVTIAASAVGCLALWPVMPLLKWLWPYESFHGQLVYAAPVAFLTVALQIVTSLLVGAKELRRLSALSAGIEVLRAILSTGGLAVGWGASSLFWGMILSRIVGIGAIWAAMPELFAVTLRHPRKTDLFRFGGWLYGGSLMSVLIVRCSDLILTTYMGTVALAVYTAAMQIPTTMQRVFESIRPALLGYVAAYQDTYRGQQVEAVRIVTALLAVATTILMTLSSSLMSLLYSDQYQAGVPIMQALSVWMTLAIVNYFYSIILIGRGEPKGAFLLTVPQLVVMLVSTLLLVPQYEGLGAAIALVITAFLGNLVGAKIVSGDDRDTWYALVANLIRAATPLALFLMIAVYVKPSFFSLICLSGATLALLIALKVVTMKDIGTLRQALSDMIGQVSVRPTPV
ncbi:MAG: oligosaccharide flippase family protein [Nitrospira sp.]|nr:oligosaccharide flippase family protein [Nitrospira sp.]